MQSYGNSKSILRKQTYKKLLDNPTEKIKRIFYKGQIKRLTILLLTIPHYKLMSSVKEMILIKVIVRNKTASFYIDVFNLNISNIF